MKVALIVSEFNNFITGHMLESAHSTLKRNGFKDRNIDVYHVPGAYEIAPVMGKVMRSGKYHAYIAIACIIKGSTPHFKYVSDHANNAISKLAIKYEAVVGNAIITCNNMKEAIERAGCKMGNKGADAARAVLETLKVLNTIH